MAAPSYSDMSIYSGTKLTNTDWNTNLHIIVNYLTDGTSDLTIGSLDCKAITSVGNASITGDLTITGNLIGSLISGYNHVGTFTRDISIASGNQSVIGIGFKPSAVIFVCAQTTPANSNAYTSIGFDNGTTAYMMGGSFVGQTVQTYSIGFNSTTSYVGKILTMDADGFTISWTKGSTPTGVLSMVYMALR
jgi:hypothetical protein